MLTKDPFKYMARYEGEIAKNDTNKLKFFKIVEEAVTSSGGWATDETMYVTSRFVCISSY
jgi:hypothetical protein